MIKIYKVNVFKKKTKQKHHNISQNLRYVNQTLFLSLNLGRLGVFEIEYLLPGYLLLLSVNALLAENKISQDAQMQ